MQAAMKMNTAASKSLAHHEMGASGSRALCVGAKAMDEGKNLKSTLKEPAGVRGGGMYAKQRPELERPYSSPAKL